MGIVESFLYYPERYPQGDWKALVASGAEERWLTTEDGVKLNAWWWPRTAGRITLFLHGNAGNLTHRILHAHVLQQAGSAFFALDYRGYGRSEGSPTEQGLYADARAGYHALIAAGAHPEQIVIHGESLGTAVAVHLGLERPCAGLVLEAPMASLSAMAGRVVPVLGPLVARGFDTLGQIGKLRRPVFVIHGDADEVVPYSQGKAVFDRANQPKTMWTVPGAHHNDLLPVALGQGYVRRIAEFHRSL